MLHPWLARFEIRSGAWRQAVSGLVADDRVYIQHEDDPRKLIVLARDGTFLPLTLQHAPSPPAAWHGVRGRVLFHAEDGRLRVHYWRSREEREVTGARANERIVRTCEDGRHDAYLSLAEENDRGARVARLTDDGRLEHVMDVASARQVTCLRGGGFVVVSTGSRELVHVDARGQRRWELDAAITTPASVPQATEWLWLVGGGEITMVDLRPLFAWTPWRPGGAVREGIDGH